MVDVGDISNALVEQKKRPDARIGDLLIASGKITEESYIGRWQGNWRCHMCG